ncbi:class I fructose-bisphosphate aldolase [Halodesulfovibrio aestuarii]|uniref:class I fructose-bisphosphate aldolase n=1 Tax=Halodesulfovibrio aestuarii TaxID=126333 RepID=UPI0035211417
MIGIYRRREHLLSTDNKSKPVIVSFEQSRMDGGFSSSASIPACVEAISKHPLTSLIVSSGFARTYGLTFPASLPLIIQLSTASKHAVPAWNRSIVCSVLEALRSGAGAVALQLAIGNEYEEKMLQDFGNISEEAHSYGLPVLLSIFAKGDRIVQEYDRALIADSISLGSELGADVIAVPYSGHQESFAQAVGDSTAPVLLTGTHGAATFGSYCKSVENGLACGADGVIVPFQILPQNEQVTSLERIQSIATLAAEPQKEDV